MRIAIDAMGGDHAPKEIIKGVLEASTLLDADDEVILIGVRESIESQLASAGAGTNSIRIVHAPEVIGMDEPPVESLRRKRKSSIAVMARMASHNEADAVVSAGNTGEMLFPIPKLIQYLSGIWELREGDLIYTGTPSGVGPLTPSDSVQIASPLLGTTAWTLT